jgi:hypothetical protein
VLFSLSLARHAMPYHETVCCVLLRPIKINGTIVFVKRTRKFLSFHCAMKITASSVHFFYFSLSRSTMSSSSRSLSLVRIVFASLLCALTLSLERPLCENNIVSVATIHTTAFSFYCSRSLLMLLASSLLWICDCRSPLLNL